MLRDIIILRESIVIYWKQNINSTSWEILSPNLDLIANYLEHGVEDQIYQGEYEDFKFSYLFQKSLNLTFILINDILDDNISIDQLLKYARKEFLRLFSAEVINTFTNVHIFETFDPVSVIIHNHFRPKITLAGFTSVGKTTIANLISSDPSNPILEPALKGSIYSLIINNLEFDLWDFIGEEKLLFVWPKYLKDSNAIIIITDSTPQIVEKSKFFIEMIEKDIPDAKYGIVANMQDTPDAVPTEELKQLFNFPKIYGMNAKDASNKESMIAIIKDILKITGEFSPRIQLMFERSNAILAGEKAEIEGNFERALANFEIVADYSRKLDEHEISQDFLNRIAQLKGKLESENEKISPKIEKSTIKQEEKVEQPVMIENEEVKETNLSEIDLLRKNIDKWKTRSEEIETELRHLEYKYMGKMINEQTYQQEKEQLRMERSDLDNKIYEARFKMIKLI